MRAGYAVVRALSSAGFHTLFGLQVHGLDRVPRSGRIILASNHRSNFDPPILGGVVPRETHFFAKEELFRGRWLGGLISYLNAFPVRRGQFDRTSLQQCLHVLEQEGCLLMFPEGTRAPADGFLKAKVGVGWVVSLSQAPVLPVYIHGSTVSRPRWSPRPAIQVIFGDPVTAAELTAGTERGRVAYEIISDRVLERIRDLSVRLPGGVVRERGPLYERSVIDNERLR
ncbi:1-acyl-sn-glycerol-3-phosphate acyltransferase [candidate division KSB1 bacterium]|nr:1-acyl-sn-glycerol-3-phosphate acyltransferase [candidate division KSB1 bacterium]